MSIRLKAPPERIFVSVDSSTGRSTISFAPASVGSPIVHEGDVTGERAMSEATSIAEAYRGSTVHGPHFHAARPPGRKRFGRKPAADAGGDD